MRAQKLLYILLFVVLLYSCRKELEKPSWNTRDIGPIVNTSLSIDNLLPDSLIQTNSDSSLSIVYQNNIFNFSMDTLFQIPDTTLSEAYTIPITLEIQPGQPVITNKLSETSYNLKGAQLKTIVIKSGYISYNIVSYIKEVTNFVYSFSSAKKDGVPFSIDINVPAAIDGVPGVYNETFDLSGYEISLTGINNNTYNTIYTSLSALISPDGDPVSVGPSDSLIIKNTFKDFVPYYAKGYFGKNTIDVGPEETDFSIFKSITNGSIQLEDISFTIDIDNPVGLDAQVYINDLNSINTRTGSNIHLQNSIVGSPINIDRAVEKNSGGIQSTYKSVPLNTSNSNIKDMVENLPDKFGYSLQLVTNPLENITGSNDFIYSDSLLRVQLNMEIPLSMVANDLTLSDTIALTLSENEDEQVINSGIITALVENGFPFTAELQLYLLNDDFTITDSLIGSINTINAAEIDSNYKAVGKKISQIAIPLSSEKMKALYATKQLLLKVIFNTSAQPQYMKIYNYYTFDLKLIGDLDFTIRLK